MVELREEYKGVIMKYRIETRNTIRFVGRKFFVPVEKGLVFSEIPSIWDKLPKVTFNELNMLSDSDPTGVVGVFAARYYDDSVYTALDYWVAVATSKPCPPHFSILELPAATWAIFEAKGAFPGALQDVFSRVHTEWFPNSAYTRANLNEIEWFSEGDKCSDSYISEAWVSVEKKQSASIEHGGLE